MKIVDIKGVIILYLGVGAYKIYDENSGFLFGCMPIVDIEGSGNGHLDLGVCIL